MSCFLTHSVSTRRRRLSVRLSSRDSIASKRPDERAGFWHGKVLSPIPRRALRKSGYLQMQGYFPLERCTRLWTSKISPASRSCCQRNSLMVELLDDTPLQRPGRHAVAVYYTSVNCNPLTRMWLGVAGPLGWVGCVRMPQRSKM